jgi:hypothetical protein
MKKLKKTTLAAALHALAEEDRRDEAEHRVRFEKMIGWAKSEIDRLSSPEQLCTSAALTFFNEANDIAKRIPGMDKAEFEAAVACLNTSISRVIDNGPSGKDTRDLPECMRMRPDELHMSYSLLSPYDASEFIAERGALAGYAPAEVARAGMEYQTLKKARWAKVAEEDRQRAAARHAKIEADLRAGYLARLKWEAEHAEEHQERLKAFEVASMPPEPAKH